MAAIFAIRKYKFLGIFVAAAYTVLYLYLTSNIVYAPDLDTTRFAKVPSIKFAEDWTDKIWRLRAPANWEPIAIIYPINHVVILLPIPNLLIAAVISILFGANFSIALYRIAIPARSGGSFSGILGAIPSLLTGFGCCVPTAALALGASFVAAFIAVGNYLLPASIVALGSALLWNASRATCNACKT